MHTFLYMHVTHSNMPAHNHRNYIDASLEKTETYQREQVLDEIGDKYKKQEPGLGSFVVQEPQTDKSETDSGTMTDRQKAMAKQKEEDERLARIEEEKKVRELKKLEEIEREVVRKQRAEDRARGLVVSLVCVYIYLSCACA
jgi:hypothetical protein